MWGLVKERQNFILRTVLAVALVILIFSLFLNKYILKPIGFLVGKFYIYVSTNNGRILVVNFKEGKIEKTLKLCNFLESQLYDLWANLIEI